MKVSVILAHPQKGSFNHAIALTAVETLQQSGHAVAFHDLYAEGFDPILPYEEIPKEARIDSTIQKHCDELREAEGIIIVHPNWWGQPPAMLKGWVDRVLRPGIAYEFVEGDKGEGVPIGLLKARTALVFNTANTPAEREERVFGDPLETLWGKCILEMCGVPSFHRKMFRVVVTSTPNEREGWLNEVRETVAKCFPKEITQEGTKG